MLLLLSVPALLGLGPFLLPTESLSRFDVAVGTEELRVLVANPYGLVLVTAEVGGEGEDDLIDSAEDGDRLNVDEVGESRSGSATSCGLSSEAGADVRSVCAGEVTS